MHSLIHIVSRILMLHVTLILSETESYYFEEVKEVNNSAGIFEVYRNKTPDSPEKPLNLTNSHFLTQEDDNKENMEDEIKFPDVYHTQGTISLPYDGIIEPFEAWYGGRHNMSRIDYYYGMDKTFQRGDLGKYGVLVKVIPVHWKKGKDLDTNSISCWYRPGYRWSKQRGQHMIPWSLKLFKYTGEEYHSGMPCLKFVRILNAYKKKNTYTLYVTKYKPHKPVRYVMHGYDTLLHSFYDHYVIDYLTFHEWKFNSEKMEIPKGNFCQKKFGKLESQFHFNPMKEFMHENFDDAEVNEMFEEYKKIHSKEYMDESNHESRKHIFRHNMRYIASKNRAMLNYSLAPNELTDSTEEEFAMYQGLLIDPGGGEENRMKQEIPEFTFSDSNTALPSNMDWREYGAVTPAKAQGHCGSCWTFSAAGAIEGAYSIQIGKLLDLSEQQLMDCSWGFGNQGCRGGLSWKALVWARKFGIASSKSYGRYLAQEGYCHCEEKDNCTVINFDTISTVKKLDETALKHGLVSFGPASVAINVNKKSFKFYSSGVYDDPDCGPKTSHGVVAVGYGEEEGGKPYWIIKNSWGKFWGDEGFIKVARENNLCGVMTNEPIFVTFKDINPALRGRTFPFLGMKKKSFVDVERELNVTTLKLSPFDYKKSEIAARNEQ